MAYRNGSHRRMFRASRRAAGSGGRGSEFEKSLVDFRAWRIRPRHHENRSGTDGATRDQPVPGDRTEPHLGGLLKVKMSS